MPAKTATAGAAKPVAKAAAKPAAKPAAKAAGKPAAKAAGKPASKVAGKVGAKIVGKVAGKAGAKAPVTVSPDLLKVDRRCTARPKSTHTGGDLPAKGAVDLSRFTRWPQYVWRQRRVRVLQARLKIPPSIHQFSRTLDADVRKEVFRFAAKYAPESKAERKQRLKAIAAAKAKGGKGAAAVPPAKTAIRCGLKCVTRLIEHKRAKLVLIASDVQPIECVMFLPALCRKQGIPYAIVKGRAQLGKLCGFKQAAAVAFDKVRPEDAAKFGDLVATIDSKFAKDEEKPHRQWGGLVLGRKSQDALRIQRAAARKAEEAMKNAGKGTL